MSALTRLRTGEIALSQPEIDSRFRVRFAPRLDALSAHLNLQCAAFLESQYERAGVITKWGGAGE